ncbi:zymogen granule membrane protein 16-like isoform X2 [Salvelinus sp. IW2-2015]|nr:zymogen granule membrane protein 16-like isoform X2 [Salvelinus alpinus]
MFSILFVGVFLASCLAMPIKEQYSYSPAVGLGSGTPFASSGEGRITAVRVWENNNAYINGFQLRYDYTWSSVFGREVGEKQEMELLDDEAIVQVSGKYNPGSYIYYLVFTTNRGRSLSAGQPSHISFNFYPAHVGSELRLLSGRSDGAGITSIGAHWGLMYMEEAGSSTSS